MADTAALRHYCCGNCGNHLSRHDDLVAKDYLSLPFQPCDKRNPRWEGGTAAGYRFLHGGCLVDVYCSDCGKVLGWKYINAHWDSQKHKEGKTVLEKFMISDSE